MSKNFNHFSDREQDTIDDLLKNYKLSPQQLAVIAAILFDALYVKSVLVDNEQTVVVLLEGSLKQESKNLNKLLNGVRHLNIGELMELLSTVGK